LHKYLILLHDFNLERFGINREKDTEWTDFEDAATYEHSRTLVEEKYRQKKK
jgi:hypothetical protein